MWRAGIFDHCEPSMYMAATVNSSGVAQDYLGPVPAGYCWYVERWTAFSNTAATAPQVELFVQTAESMPSSFSATVGDRAGRQDLSLAANNDAADLNSPICVPEGYYLVAFWSGFTSADVASLATQVAVHLTSLHIESPQLVAQQAGLPPGVDAEGVAEEEGLVARLEHATADLFRSIDKAV